MNDTDEAFKQLLTLLRTHPKLVEGIIFDPASITELLDSEACKNLVLGTEVSEFLRNVASSTSGPPIAVRAKHTLCKGDTKIQLCLGGTTGAKKE